MTTRERYRIHRAKYVIVPAGWHCIGCNQLFPTAVPAHKCIQCNDERDPRKLSVYRCSRCWRRHEEHMREVDGHLDEPSAWGNDRAH